MFNHFVPTDFSAKSHLPTPRSYLHLKVLLQKTTISGANSFLERAGKVFVREKSSISSTNTVVLIQIGLHALVPMHWFSFVPLPVNNLSLVQIPYRSIVCLHSSPYALSIHPCTSITTNVLTCLLFPRKWGTPTEPSFHHHH